MTAERLERIEEVLRKAGEQLLADWIADAVESFQRDEIPLHRSLALSGREAEAVRDDLILQAHFALMEKDPNHGRSIRYSAKEISRRSKRGGFGKDLASEYLRRAHQHADVPQSMRRIQTILGTKICEA